MPPDNKHRITSHAIGDGVSTSLGKAFQAQLEPHQMTTARERWYRQPVVWVGVAILLASIAGCIALIILASRYPDEPVQPSADKLLRVPLTREPQRSP